MSSSDIVYTLSPCTEEDIPSLCKVWEASFATSKSHSLIFPPSLIDPVDLASWYCDRLKQMMTTHPELRFYKVTLAETGEIAAWSRWVFPHERSLDQTASKPRFGDALEGMNTAFDSAIKGTLDEWRAKYVNPEDTYVTELMLTHPSHQRKGLATRLLRFVFDQADKEGRRCYIEASPDGYPVYVKAGFKEVDRIDFGLEEFGGDAGERDVAVCMIREAVRGA